MSYSQLGSPCDFRDFLHGVAADVEQQDDALLLQRQRADGLVQFLVLEGIVGAWAARHLIRRVHGGAVLNVAGSVEPEYGQREIEHYEQKIRIGKKAAEYVEDGDSIILDIGTTTLEFARFLKGKRITVFTNSLKIAMELMQEESMQVLLLGGKLRMGEGTTSGAWAEDMIRQFYADKLFLGVGALHPEKGITFVKE